MKVDTGELSEDYIDQVRLPPFFDHGSAFLKWNLRQFIASKFHATAFSDVILIDFDAMLGSM